MLLLLASTRLELILYMSTSNIINTSYKKYKKKTAA